MKKYLPWILLAAAAAAVWFFFFKKKPASTAKTSGQTNTNTATKPSGALDTWVSATQKILGNSAATSKAATDQNQSIVGNIISLFGGNSKASGAVAPATSGSGAGVPADSSGDSEGATDEYTGDENEQNSWLGWA